MLEECCFMCTRYFVRILSLPEMKKIILVLFLVLVTVSGFLLLNEGKSKEQKNLPERRNTQTSTDTIFSLVFGGDLMAHLSMTKSAYRSETGTYEFEHWFQYIAPYIKSCDYAVANLEFTLAGPPYTGFPRFSSADSYASAIRNAGFDLLVTANNHSQDRGRKGLERTLKVLDSLGIPHTGTFADTADFFKNYPFMFSLAGCRLAILNYSYSTNGIPVTGPNVVNMIDSGRIKNDLQKARASGAELIIPVMHWGSEYKIQENPAQRRLAEMMAEHGAHAIIGMHPHVVEPIKGILTRSKRSVPVAYSLGNLVSAQRKRHCDGGILIKLNCRRKNGIVLVENWSYLPFWVWNHRSAGKEDPVSSGFYMLPEKNLNILPRAERIKAELFFSDTREILKGTEEWKSPE